jgi:RHS repeat-associated protein
LGTPQELTNADGRVVWAARYRAWGNVLEVVKEEALLSDEIGEAQPVRFQGQYYDNETGLHYNRFRYYDPDIGRFVSIDPIGLFGGTNLYQYSPNPVSWVDPLGWSPCKGNESVAPTSSGILVDSATPNYNGVNPIPRGVTLIGEGNNGFSLGVTILNPIGF